MNVIWCRDCQTADAMPDGLTFGRCREHRRQRHWIWGATLVLMVVCFYLGSLR